MFFILIILKNKKLWFMCLLSNTFSTAQVIQVLNGVGKTEKNMSSEPRVRPEIP
jgi:hypothetical protein